MEYIFTERAHLMCPNMCFGIVMCINAELDESRIADTVKCMSSAHPFIRALISHDEKENRFFYDVKDVSQAEISICSVNDPNTDSPEIIDEFERITSRDPDLFKEGMLKISVWPSGAKTIVLMVFHHLLADGRGALELSKEFADYYVLGKQPVYAEEKLISSVAEFPENSRLPFISRLLVNRANRQWKKENKRLSFEDYHRFADDHIKTDKVKHNLSVLQISETNDIAEKCRTEGVTVNDYLLAKLFTEDKIKRIVMAMDIRKALKCYNPGAMGNYSTAFSVEINSFDDDIFTMAKQVHEKVRQITARPSSLYLVLQCYVALDPGMLDAAMMASRGRFESKAAGFIGKNFFHMDRSEGYSITNLGKTESDVIEDAYFIPPASPAMKKTLGVLTLNGKMRICTSER
ncbi:condensation domain-containing protein [Ruminococcus albus]|uniref:condensation domain-containing protein n=1 Tax=Ruminococcus albus TaxID=1264 RepID=UPI000464BF03